MIKMLSKNKEYIYMYIYIFQISAVRTGARAYMGENVTPLNSLFHI